MSPVLIPRIKWGGKSYLAARAAELRPLGRDQRVFAEADGKATGRNTFFTTSLAIRFH